MAKKFPEIKKELSHFISDESGIISKETILKAGITIGSVLALSKPVAGTDTTTHTNTGLDDTTCGEEGGSVSHNHHASHASTSTTT